MNRIVTLILAIGCASTLAGAEPGFTLDIERELDRPRVDPRTEARLAQWNSPIGRVMHHVNEQQAMMLRGGQPQGTGSLAFRVKLQKGFPVGLIAAPGEASVDFYERSVAVVRWPWRKDGKPALSIEEQISLLLGKRLGSPPRPEDAD